MFQIRRLRRSDRKAKPVLINLSVTGTVSPSVLRCRILAPYVPLRTRCSESVPVTDRVISTGSALRSEFRNRLIIQIFERNKHDKIRSTKEIFRI